MRVDDIFTPDGLAVALVHGIEPTEEVDEHRVTLTDADLLCGQCGNPVDPPRDKPGRYLAIQKIALETTQCPECLRAAPD